mgnify:CR=1 FL=1|tara:strand:- start:271 stop:960 length:690 start_codon:yes stop_codon:yes gene_type:complete
MATITSTYTDPSDTFVWWIEGDRLGIATIEGDGNTSETGKGNLKAVQLGSTVSLQSTGDPLPNNLLNEALDASETEVDVDEGGQFSAGQIIQIDNELMKIVSISTNTLTVTRGYNNTTAAAHDNDSTISTLNVVSDGIIISYYAEPDKLSSITGTIDIDNVLQPGLIDYVKGKALMDAAARATDPGLAQIKMASAQQCMASYKECVRRYGMKKNDKTGGTRAVVPADMR